jgi:hypothetical protein
VAARDRKDRGAPGSIAAPDGSKSSMRTFRNLQNLQNFRSSSTSGPVNIVRLDTVSICRIVLA